MNLHHPVARRIEQQKLGQGILNLILQVPADFSGAGLAALPRQHPLQLRPKPQAQAVFPGSGLEPGQLTGGDFLQSLPAQGAEDRDLVDAAQKLRGKMPLQALQDPLLPGLGQKTEALALPPFAA